MSAGELVPRRSKGVSKPTEGQVSRPATFVVDYDLPSDFRRKRFYRAMVKIRASLDPETTGWSTGSVVFTDSEEFVWRVYEEARAVGGVAHVWRAERVKEERRP